MASVVQIRTHISFENRRLRVENQLTVVTGYLASITVVRLDGEWTTTALSHIRLPIAFDESDDSFVDQATTWVEGVDYPTHDVRYGEVYTMVVRGMVLELAPLHFVAAKLYLCFLGERVMGKKFCRERLNLRPYGSRYSEMALFFPHCSNLRSRDSQFCSHK